MTEAEAELKRRTEAREQLNARVQAAEEAQRAAYEQLVVAARVKEAQLKADAAAQEKKRIGLETQLRESTAKLARLRGGSPETPRDGRFAGASVHRFPAWHERRSRPIH